jgi:peptide/nickel transport system permease protein
MFTYIVKRILTAVPTFWLVLMVSFGLSKCHSTDPALEMCRLEGINPGSSVEADSYAKYYKDLYLDKPAFYFSLVPNYYHPNPNEIIDVQVRSQLISMQNEGVDGLSALKYINVRDSLIGNGDFLAKELQFTTSIADIQKFIFKHSDHTISKLGSTLKPKTHFYPKFLWHGTDNQAHIWLASFLGGDMGISIRNGLPVSSRISSAIKWTILLMVLHIVISTVLSISVGMICANYKDRWQDNFLQNVALLFYSVPTFWLASMLLMYFTSDRYGMNLFSPPGNWVIEEDISFIRQVLSQGNQLLLPVLCLVINDIAFFSKIVRSRILDESKKLYVIMAKARGLSAGTILSKYIMPNTLITLITSILSMIPAGISGSLLIEVIFNIPGMGRLMYESIQIGDWSVVYGVVSIIGSVTIVSIIIGDIIYGLINPIISEQYG